MLLGAGAGAVAVAVAVAVAIVLRVGSRCSLAARICFVFVCCSVL